METEYKRAEKVCLLLLHLKLIMTLRLLKKVYMKDVILPMKGSCSRLREAGLRKSRSYVNPRNLDFS